MSYVVPTVTALRAVNKDYGFKDTFTKDADVLQAPASTMKMLTAWTARRWLPDSALDDTVTVITADLVGGSTANLTNGDVITYRDLFYGMLLPSGNDAATTIARTVGDRINTARGTALAPIDAFLAEMRNECAAFGFSGFVINDVTGLSNDNRLTIRELIRVIQNIHDSDPFLRTVMGTLTRTTQAPTVPALTWTHTIDPNGTVKFPEFVLGKTGTIQVAGACVLMVWKHPNNGRIYFSGLLNSTDADRFPDLRRMIDAAISNATRVDSFAIRDGRRYAVKKNIIRDGNLIAHS